MNAISDYSNVADARSNFKRVLDAAAAKVPSVVRRDNEKFAVVDAATLRHFLGALVRRPEMIGEADGWSVFIPGVPVAADGETFAEAVDEMVDALREYAQDWADHLRLSPNHKDNWGLVQLTVLSTDDQLCEWIRGQ